MILAHFGVCFLIAVAILALDSCAGRVGFAGWVGNASARYRGWLLAISLLALALALLPLP